MRRPIEINIPNREWQTYYPPEKVGAYLNSLRLNLDPNQIIELKLGQMIIPPPEPSLEGFLRWCAGGSDLMVGDSTHEKRQAKSPKRGSDDKDPN